LAVLSVAGWWKFSENWAKNSNPIDSLATEVVSLDSSNTTDQIVDEIQEPASDFPKTDSLLAAYYQSNPRTLTDLDKVITTLDIEQNNNPTAAQTKWKEVKDEQKELLMKFLQPLDIILNSAENAYRDRQIEDYKNLIEEAEGFFNDAIEAQWRELPIVKERFQRLQRIKSYDEEVDINHR
jgi:mevalonate kinase